MAELIFLIVIIAFVCKKAGVALDLSNQVEVLDKNKNPWEGVAYQETKQATRVQSARTQIQQQTAQAVQEQIAKTKQRIMESRGMKDTSTQRASAMQQVYEGRMEARNTSILQRAKVNAEEDKVDVTLETMEAEHNHSERVSVAEHHHPEDIIPENMLGKIEDLMIKGYDGNLCFERDFVGEGLDMISRFTVPSDVPDFSSNDVA